MTSSGKRQTVSDALGIDPMDDTGFFPAIMNALERQVVAADTVLIRQSDPVESLWIVESGQLDGKGGLADQQFDLERFDAGQMVPTSLRLAQGPSLLTLTTTDETVLWCLPLAKVDQLRREWPMQMTAIRDRWRARAMFLSLVLGLRQSILFAGVNLPTTLELAKRAKQLVVPGGKTLFREGDLPDAIYIVINGRLDVLKTLKDGKTELLNEIGPGESIGELGLVTDQRRTADVVARRDTTVARIDKSEYLEILRRDPEGLARGLVRTAQGVSIGMARFRRQVGGGNIPSFALIAATPDLPLREAAQSLEEALGRRGTIIMLDSKTCAEAGHMVNDETGNSSERHSALLSWLNDLERYYSCLLYVADDCDSPWTRLCARQTDNVLLMVDGSAPAEVGAIERCVRQIEAGTKQQLTLLLVQPRHVSTPTGTAKHLAVRQVDQYVHVRDRNPADWARVARMLTGHSVGVVFGGGGARGFAHIGVIRALEEYGIPVDTVGGASMGALVAGQYALGRGPEEILDSIMSMVRRGDRFTLPLVSLMSGRRFSRGMHELMGDGDIEDSWRKFFCVSCNLTTAKSVVHSTGSLWRAMLASNSPPGLLPPVVHGGELLVDGGLLDGLPTDTMNKFNGKGLLIVINVMPKSGVTADHNYDYGLSGWKILWKRINPMTRAVAMPNIVEILTRSMAIGSVANRASMLQRTTDLLLEPELAGYSVTDHAKGAKIADLGYEALSAKIGGWWNDQLKLH